MSEERKYSCIGMTVPKGNKEKVKQMAAYSEVSVNQLFMTAVKAKLENINNAENAESDSEYSQKLEK